MTWRERAIRGAVVAAAAALLLAACGGESESRATPLPTRTLIPPTATPALTASPAVPTPTDLPAPAMLAPSPVQTEESGVPEALQTLIDRTSADLVSTQGVALDDVRLLSLDRFAWDDPAWRCQGGYETAFTAPDGGPGYRIVFTDGYRAYVYYAYQIGDSSEFSRCADRDWLTREGEPVLDDPVAAAMVVLALPDAARRLNVEPGDLQLVSLLSLTWPDSSLGCPKAGADYADELTPGYRLVLRAGDRTILYHASSREVMVCTPDEEILPGMLRASLATPVPDGAAQ